eukprot:11213545-Lingulodinium_polyedra.AAC.1
MDAAPAPLVVDLPGAPGESVDPPAHPEPRGDLRRAELLETIVDVANAAAHLDVAQLAGPAAQRLSL